MSKSKVLQNIKNYGDLRGDVALEIIKIKENRDLTNQAKRNKIAEVEARNEASLKASRDALTASVKELKAELEAQRKAQVARGMDDAEKIALVVNGIKSNAFAPSMVKDLVDGFADNPIALASIRTELARSQDADYNTLAIDIPKDANSGSYRVIGNLDNIVHSLNEENSIGYQLDNADTDIATRLYVSGDTFNSWHQYITDNVAE